MINNKQIHQLTLESLRDWFKKEKWVRISSSGKIAGPCGTSKNKKNPDRCLPKAKAQSLTKSQRAATAAKKKKAGKKGKTVVKNTKKATVRKESLWANINAKKKAGKKSSHKNSNAYKAAKKAGNVLKQETKGAPKGHYFTKSGNLVKGRLTKDARERGARLSDPKDKQRSKVPPVTQYNELDLPNSALIKINADVKNAKTMALSILQYIDAVDDKEQPAIFKNSKLRRAIELLKDLGDDQEEVQEIDINDPALMKARAMKIKRAKQKQASKPRGISYEDALDLRLKLQDLEDERADVLRNMEQEAEPEGGPIADDYGAILNDLDKKIDSIMNKLQQYDMNETANPQDGKAAPFGSGFKKVNEMTIEDIKNLTVGLLHEIQGKEVLMEKDDRCTRIAKRKYDTWPSAYASGAVVRCRRGEIWKGVKEELNEQMDIYDEIANMEFGMDYDQLGSNEKEWVRDEIDNMEMRESLKDKNNAS
jgi:hypothetical protein